MPGDSSFWRSPPRLSAFLVTALLLAASMYPMVVMIRTSLQSVGDPLEGTPSSILLAEASRGDLTLQNTRMEGGAWDDVEGFRPVPGAWALDEGTRAQVAVAPGAAWRLAWEGDLRRHARMLIELEGDGAAGWRVVWENRAGQLAIQNARPAPGAAIVDGFGALAAAGESFELREITAMILVAPGEGGERHGWRSVTTIPRRLTLVNFSEVWRADAFSRYTFNSLLVALLVTAGAVATSLCAGYAFARGDARVARVFWALVIGSMLIPSQVLIVPAFLILQHFPLLGGNDLLGQGGIGLLDSYAGLVLPNLVMPLGIFLVRQTILSMPESYEEAAVMDGARLGQVLWHVIAPLQRPILATVALLAFLFNWNAFIFPLIIIQSPEMRTLPVGLALYSARNTVDWVHLMAAATITALPVFVLFAFFQRQLISGLVQEGIKG